MVKESLVSVSFNQRRWYRIRIRPLGVTEMSVDMFVAYNLFQGFASQQQQSAEFWNREESRAHDVPKSFWKKCCLIMINVGGGGELRWNWIWNRIWNWTAALLVDCDVAVFFVLHDSIINLESLR
jgi:hypothetical protein